MALAVVGMVAMVGLIMAMCAQLHKRVQNKEASDGEASSKDRKDEVEVRETPCMKMGLSKKSNKRLLGVQEQHWVGEDPNVNRHNDDVSIVPTSTSAVWSQSILMGERCEPPTFSGLILYDERGNLLQGLPLHSPQHHRPTSPSLRQLMSST
ncbi:hypothetical protein GOP47_0025185 [Adiantum capillus-veneris]|uniref:Uncharacterized protein n=1 Tax=Adiantum capillus-veneris TaxID=13818 RepID=A0A9D4U472_ADICA|nr:hypothetical protein GOP47_0025185 [Adiantum capillus-veneris]